MKALNLGVQSSIEYANEEILQITEEYNFKKGEEAVMLGVALFMHSNIPENYKLCGNPITNSVCIPDIHNQPRKGEMLISGGTYTTLYGCPKQLVDNDIKNITKRKQPDEEECFGLDDKTGNPISIPCPF